MSGQKDIEQRKIFFIEQLKNLYMGCMPNVDGITDMQYLKDKSGEYLLVNVMNKQYQVTITADNERGILIDFAMFLQNMDNYKSVELVIKPYKESAQDLKTEKKIEKALSVYNEQGTDSLMPSEVDYLYRKHHNNLVNGCLDVVALGFCAGYTKGKKETSKK